MLYNHYYNLIKTKQMFAFSTENKRYSFLRHSVPLKVVANLAATTTETTSTTESQKF
jgi:hypothetical protein